MTAGIWLQEGKIYGTINSIYKMFNFVFGKKMKSTSCMLRGRNAGRDWLEETNLDLWQSFNSWMAAPSRSVAVLGWVTWEVQMCNFVAVQPNQVCLRHMQIPVEIKRFIICFYLFIYFTTRFTLPQHEEIISISPLDEHQLKSNYLTTIDGTLVNNLGAEQYETGGGGGVCFVALTVWGVRNGPKIALILWSHVWGINFRSKI